MQASRVPELSFAHNHCALCRPTTDEVIAVLHDLLTSESFAMITEFPAADATDASPPPTLPQAVRDAIGDDSDIYLASERWQPVMRQAAAASAGTPSVLDILSRVRLINVFAVPPPPGVLSDVLWDTGGAQAAEGFSTKRGSAASGGGGGIPRQLQSTLDADFGKPARATSCSVTSADESDDFHNAMEELRTDESLFRCACIVLGQSELGFSEVIIVQNFKN
jgi:hypothetical protein